jgi:hypothetical protein
VAVRTHGNLLLAAFDGSLPFVVRSAEGAALHVEFELDVTTAARFRAVPDSLVPAPAAA